ncbi:SH3 domain-containing protein [Bellilinea sp.]|jgi:hypothetical protein|uniref:SH3 domain-containing protein n=1 Tax=Bellilinea sp. TaxID=2838785 RepID=UPI002ADD5478|nr:hypothetical protein [Bellilinea sp.]
MRNLPASGCGTIILSALIALLIGAAIIAGTLLLRPTQVELTQEATAVLTIVPAPTSTIGGQMSLFATPTATQPALSITIDGIRVGLFVQIFGTGGDGLRLRREPGTNTDILFLGYESEVFKVVDGPKEADGFTWWYLTAPYDEKRSGWAASRFLRVIDLGTESQP